MRKGKGKKKLSANKANARDFYKEVSKMGLVGKMGLAMKKKKKK